MVRKLAVFIVVFIVCSLAFLPFSARADWQSFLSSKDSIIRALYPDAPWWGTSDMLVVGVIPDDRVRTLVQFDLSSISGSTVSSAILKLYYYTSVWLPAGRWLNAYRVTQSWTELGVTWNEYDYFDGLTTPTNDWATLGGDYTTDGGASAMVPSSYGLMTWDVTDIVKAWVAGSEPNYGFLIKDSTETDPPYGLAFFYSHEAWYGYRPTLEVTYTPPPRLHDRAWAYIHLWSPTTDYYFIGFKQVFVPPGTTPINVDVVLSQHSDTVEEQFGISPCHTFLLTIPQGEYYAQEDLYSPDGWHLIVKAEIGSAYGYELAQYDVQVNVHIASPPPSPIPEIPISTPITIAIAAIVYIFVSKKYRRI